MDSLNFLDVQWEEAMMAFRAEGSWRRTLGNGSFRASYYTIESRRIRETETLNLQRGPLVTLGALCLRQEGKGDGPFNWEYLA